MRKHKARFFARGENQIEVVDYFEIYAPVAAWSTVRMVVNIVIKKNGPLDKLIYQTPSFKKNSKKKYFLSSRLFFRRKPE